MADETVSQPKPKKIHRVQIGLNVVVQIALILFLAAMVNYLGFEHYKRWDFSRDKKYALSDKTKRVLDTLKGKMRMTVFFGPSNPIATDVQNLLTEYQYAAKGKIDVENVDPERNLSRAKELFDKYKVVSDESLLIIDYQGRNKTVKASEMAEIDQGNPMLGEQPKIAAFKGEQAITSAMIDLVEGKKNTLGYILGHKEPPIARAQPDLHSQNVHRKREREVSAVKLVRSPGDSRGDQDNFHPRSAVRFLRSRDEVVARFLGKAGTDSVAARSDSENAEARRISQRARGQGERRSPDGEREDRNSGSCARARCSCAFHAG